MRRPLCLLCLAFVGILVLCMQFMPLPLPDYGGWDGQYTVLEGQVCGKEYRQVSGRNILVISLKKINILKHSSESPQNQIKGVICYMKDGAKTALGREPALGNRIRVKGKVRCFEEAGNPGEFNSRQYYSILEMDFKLQNAEITASGGKENGWEERLYRLRMYFSSVLDHYFEEKEASVMKAVLLGEKSGLDSEIKELYLQNGIIHILSISGLHISMIGMGLYRLLLKGRLPRKAAAFLSAILIIFYGVMTGMSVSSLRAVLMFALYLAAQMTGRTYDLKTAVSLAAVLILVRQPRYVFHSGFLFSFSAVAGISALLPALCSGKKGLWRKLAPGIAIALATLPVQLNFNYSFPIYSILLNLLIIPLMTIVMYAGLLCMSAGGLNFFPLHFAAWVAAGLDRAILWFYEKCCFFFSGLPYSGLILGQPEPWQIALYVSMLVFLILFHKKVPAWWKGQWLLLAICFLLFRVKDGLLITALDVGQGDCIHIVGETGNHYLIDGGSSSKKDTADWQIIPYLKSRGAGRLTAVWVTHADSDHCNGIKAMLEEYGKEDIRIENLILPYISEESKNASYRELAALASQKGIRVMYMSRGQFVTDGRLCFTCLHPEKNYETADANAYSLVLRVTYGSFTGLLTGDIEGEGEQEMKCYLKENRNIYGNDRLSLLKAAHHGSANSTDEELLAMLRPRISFISCGKNNSYGHPHPELLKRLSACKSEVYITKDAGALTVWTDGKRMRVSTFKKAAR